MSLLFNLPVEGKNQKTPSVHPWDKTIKDRNHHRIKTSHNSVKNVVYPKPKEKVPTKNRVTFTVIGNMITKEFLYCVNLVQGMHKYRWKKYNPPVIKACTAVEWESNVLKDLKAKYGDLAHCLKSQVAVISNDEFIGGEKELKDLIESKYYIHLLAMNYQKESEKQFAKFIKEIGRPCAYLHISINQKPIGSLIFMLYSDIVPQTCENFLRLCQLRRGGYSGTPVHRIVKDGWIQCGGFGLKDTNMECENYIVPHDRRGVLAMANAGRNLDCSTQFFVLLQPNPCFKIRFVAFGQLIDGEETLKKIEGVKTFYEAPLDIVIIYSAGVVNLECQDIRINKGAREYINKHIDDLVIIGEMFYEMLLENVFLELEFRQLQKLKEDGEEEVVNEAFGETVDEYGNSLPENMKATRRFIRKKDEIATQMTQDGKRKSTAGRPSTAKNNENLSENKDFDVDEYNSAYEPEEYSYSQVSGSSSFPKPTKPYYLALTDVPYPKEVDSTFDLKRFLQGDYCLEADLKSNQTETEHQKGNRQAKIRAISDIISSYGGVKWGVDSSSDSEDTSSSEIESDEEREIKNYLQQYGEKVCFSGHVVKDISKKYVSTNPVEEKGSQELWNDEEIRRMRLAMQDMKSRENKKVSINVEPWETHKEIKRRVTGFVKAQDLISWVQPEENLDEDDDDDEYTEKQDIKETETRKVSVSICAPESTARQIKRRQTGFIRDTYKDKNEEDEEEKPEKKGEPVNRKEAGKKNTRVRYSRKSVVRIAPPVMNTKHLIHHTPNTSQKTSRKGDTETETRPSVLMRLYDDIAIDDMSPVPTLRDYKPMMAETKKKTFSLAEDFIDNPLLSMNENYFQQFVGQESSMEEVPTSTKRRSTARKISTPDETANSPGEHRFSHSIRSIEYSKMRPSITVSQYKLKIKEEMEMADANKTEEENDNKSLRSGLRLPGDSPVYDIEPDEADLHSHGSILFIKKHLHHNHHHSHWMATAGHRPPPKTFKTTGPKPPARHVPLRQLGHPTI